MTVISAAAMRVRTMADGSLRIEVEVEPGDAQQAFALFGRPGAPMALAALAEGHAAVKEPEAPKGGRRSQWLAMRCKEPAFREFLKTKFWASMDGVKDEASAADAVRQFCGVERSRAEIDTSPAASARLDLLRKDWMMHNGLSA